MLKKARFVLLAVSLLGLVTFFPKPVARDSGAAFAIEAVLPENQRPEGQGTYFDLLVAPGASQELAVQVTNLSDEKLTVALAVHGAVTNDLGVIDYHSVSEKDPTAQLVLPEVLRMPDTVDLAPREVKVVTGQLTLPPESFRGFVLGSIVASRPLTSQQKASGLTLANVGALVLGVLLTEEATDTVKPELVLEEVTPGLFNGFVSVLAQLHNIQPELVGELTITGTVTRQEGGSFKKETVKTKQSFAPNSSYAFPVDWGGETIEAGAYRLHLVAENAVHRWEFTKEFSVTAEVQEKINRTAVGLKEPRNDWWLWLLAGLVLAALLWWFLWWRRRREEEEEEEL